MDKVKIALAKNVLSKTIDDNRLNRMVALMINLTAFLALVTYFGSF